MHRKRITSVFDLSEHKNDLLVLQQWCIIVIIRAWSLLSRRTHSSGIFIDIDLSCIPVQWAWNQVEALVDSLIQIPVFCHPKPWVGAFIYRRWLSKSIFLKLEWRAGTKQYPFIAEKQSRDYFRIANAFSHRFLILLFFTSWSVENTQRFH